MRQNLISFNPSDTDLADMDSALDTLERVFTGLKALDVKQRRSLRKMGDKSEAFVRQTLNVLAQNRQLIPPAFDLDEAQRDLATTDKMRPRFARLERLSEKASDSALALGSDAMVAAQDGYALLKQFGKSQGLDSLRETIAARFARAPKKAAATPAA